MERASETPWVMEIGNPSSREHLVMSSAYDQASERASERTPSVQTLGAEEGRLEVSLTGDLRNAIFSRRDLSEKNSFRYSLCQRTFGDVELTFKIEFI